MQIDINLLHNRYQNLCDFMCQQSEHTCFIPPLQFVNIKQCDKFTVNRDLCQDPVKLHKYVDSFKWPNFLGARVQVNFDMNLDLVDLLAKDYWDCQLPLYLRFGFPMDFKGTLPVLYIGTPLLASIQSMLKLICKMRYTIGLYLAHFTINLLVGILMSPPLSLAQNKIVKKKVIIDLSWPPGPVSMVSLTAMGLWALPLSLHNPSVDTSTDRLRQLGRGALMHKIDLSQAFRQLKVDPQTTLLFVCTGMGLTMLTDCTSLARELGRWGAQD